MPYLPTGAVLLPDTETLLVCDGYGSSFVHGYSTVDGSYIKGSSFGKIGGEHDRLQASVLAGLRSSHGEQGDEAHNGSRVDGVDLIKRYTDAGGKYSW